MPDIHEKPKILVIDDDDTAIAEMEAILNENGFTPICADSGEGGLKKAKTEQPTVIILDRRMPGMDGDEVLAELKANKDTRDIPVIMLTGSDRSSDIGTSLALGACDYIVKPFDSNNFLLRLQRALERGC